MQFEYNLTYSAHSPEAFRTFPSDDQIFDPNGSEPAARARDLQEYGLKRAIMCAWSRELPRKVTEDINRFSEPTGIAPIRVALSAAETLCNFRTAYGNMLFSPSLFTGTLLRCTTILAQHWARVWLKSEMEDGMDAPLAKSFYYRGFGHPDYLGRLASWFNRMNLSMDAVQQAIARLVPSSRATQYWQIFLTGLARYLQKGWTGECMSALRVHAGWEWRFELFSRLMRDPYGAQTDIARRIRDPVTLGGAFGLHAIHKQSHSSTEVRTEALALDAVCIIDLALHDLPNQSERMAEQAISAFLGVPFSSS